MLPHFIKINQHIDDIYTGFSFDRGENNAHACHLPNDIEEKVA